MKEGFGQVTYVDGSIYEGYFLNDVKHGKGKVIINGVSVFEGEFIDDLIEGEGQIKSLKLFSTQKC